MQTAVAPQQYQSTSVAPPQVAYQSPQAPTVGYFPSTGQTPQYLQTVPQYQVGNGWNQVTTPMAVAPTQSYNYAQPQPNTQYLPPQYQYQPSAQRHQYKIDLYGPSGKDAQGNDLESVINLIAAWGGGSPEVAIARLHQHLIAEQDRLAAIVDYVKALEQESVSMYQILENPVNTGTWLQYLEFHANELPLVRQFRSQYPQEGFDVYMKWLYSISQDQAPQQPMAAQARPSVNGWENAALGTPQPISSSPQQFNNPVQLLRALDGGHFGAAFQSLAN